MLSKCFVMQLVKDASRSRYYENKVVVPSDLLPPHPASLTHKNPQRRNIIHGMHPVGHKERWIDLNFFGRISCEDSENIQYFFF